MKNYQATNISFAEALINSYDTFLESPEHLRTPADMRAFLAAHGIVLAVPPTEAELVAVRALRAELRAIWNAEAVTIAVERLNRLFVNLIGTPRLTYGADSSVMLEIIASSSDSLLERVTLAGAWSLMTQLQTHGHTRMRACAAEPCRDVFVDTSRNRTRRFCSDRCANRYNVAAFRERKKEQGG